MDYSLLILLVFTLKQVIALEPTISITCKGEHQYLDKDDVCRQCETCSAGHQPKEYCGYGDRHPEYGCEICPDGFYSLRSDYNVCIQCRPCEDWNSEISLECSSENDRTCGPCFEGFFRPLKSDGSLDDECHSCAVAPRGTSQCETKPDSQWQKIAFIAFAIGAGLAVLVLLLIVYICCRRRRRRRRKKEAARKKGVKGQEAGTGETRESLLQSRESSRNSRASEDSRLDAEVSVQNEQEIAPPRSISHPVVSVSPRSVPASHISETFGAKNDTTRFPVSFPQFSDSGYSNTPTAQFVESPPQSHDSQSPSNLSTRLYDDLHPSQTVRPQQPQPGPSANFRLPSRPRHRPMEPSSSSDNLLLHVDRDSTLVGGHGADVNAHDVEPFDTRSVSEKAA